MNTNHYQLIISSILFVSANNNSVKKVANRFLSKYCKNLFSSTSLKDALSIFQSNSIDIVICDTNQNDGYYFNFLYELKTINKNVVSILLSDTTQGIDEKNVQDLELFHIFVRPLKSTLFLEKIFEADKKVTLNKKYKLLQKEQLLEEIFSTQSDNIRQFMNRSELAAVYANEDGKVVAFNQSFVNLFEKEKQLEGVFLHELLIQDNGSKFEKNFLNENEQFNSATTFQPDIIYSTKVKTLELGFNTIYIVEFDVICETNSKMKPKILLVEDSPVARKIVKRELDPQVNGIEYKEAQSAEDAIEILNDFTPCIIICDLVLPNMSGVKLIEYLKNEITLCNIPIIVMSELDNMCVNKNLIDLGVNSFIQKPFKPTQLQNRILSIKKESKPCLDVKTKKLVTTVCKFTNKMHEWQMLKCSAAALIEHFELSDSKIAYGHYSLGLLASSNSDKDILNHSIDFAKTFELSEQFLAFLESLKNPTSMIEQIFNAVWKEFLESKGIECNDIVTNNQAILSQLDQFIQNNRVHFNDGDGVRESIAFYKKILENFEIDSTQKREFSQIIQRTLQHQLIYASGGSCELKEHDGEVTFLFLPKTNDMRNIDKLMQSLESFQNNFDILFEEIDNTTALAIKHKTTQISIQTATTTPDEDDDIFFDFSSDECQVSSSNDTPKIDALTFISEIDMEDVESLEFIENDLLIAISEFSFTNEKNQKLDEIGELFRKYATTIIYLREFETISQSLCALASQFVSTDINNIDSSLANMLPNILENLVTDLQNWRESIFVYNQATDVHFLDSSISNNCSQCITFITPKKAVEENEADIFF